MAVILTKVWLRDVEWPDDTHSGSRFGDKKISRITIHCAAGTWPTIQSAYNCIHNRSYKATWTYAIAANGEIGQFLSESRRPGTSSNRYNDNKAVTMEVSCEPRPPWTITDESLGSIINLCEDICVRNNIPGLYYTGDIRTSNLTLHKWFANKSCPGEDIISKLPFIATSVNNRLKNRGITLLPYTDPVSDATYSLSNYRPSVAHGSIDWDNVYQGDDCYNFAMYGYTNLPKEFLTHEKLYPYIATFSRNSVFPDDSDTLKEAFHEKRICGAVIEAGCLYNAYMIEQTFRSPALYEHMRKLDSADIPYGFWMIGRARTADQAKKEMAELRPCVQLAKMNLGVWLDIRFSTQSTVENNDSILNIYKTKLHEMGLVGKIGLYVTPEQLKQITWEDHCNDWLLWLIEHVPTQADIDNLDNLLIPDFWNVEHAKDLADQVYDTNSTMITFGQPYPFPDFGGEDDGVPT